MSTECDACGAASEGGHPLIHAPDCPYVERDALQREAAAYKWAYEYLQSRMESIGRNGWAHDCDGEIEARIAAGVEGRKP